GRHRGQDAFVRPRRSAHRRVSGRLRPRHRSHDRPGGGRPLGFASTGTAGPDPGEHLLAVCRRPTEWKRARMRGTLAVYQKELATYFRSPIAYYVVAVFLLGTGYFFLYNVFLTGETTMAGTLQNMGILLLTLAPVISMRLFSAEYGAGTAELLGFWLVGHLQDFQRSDVLRSLVGYLSFARHFTDFIQGLVRTEAVAFYLVVSAVALTLSASYLQWRR